ncbi:MAG: phosphatase PAP2 family protein [Ignavibacteriales bacterium]
MINLIKKSVPLLIFLAGFNPSFSFCNSILGVRVTQDSLRPEGSATDSLPGAQMDSGSVIKVTATTRENGGVDAAKSEYMPKWYEMISNVPGDWVRYYRTEMTSDNLPLYVYITALTAQLILVDDITWRESEKLYKSSTFSKNWSDIFTEIGDGRTQFGLAAAYAAYGLIGSDKRSLRTASQIVEAVLACGAVVQVLKHLTGRESPYVSSQPGGVWRFFPNQILYHKHVPEYDAFPSGHIATSMAAFVVIAENYPEYKWMKPVSYSLAALIGIGMANKGIHWYSDYPLGIALGYAFGKLIAHPEEIYSGKPGEKQKYGVSLSPYLSPVANGLSFTLSF